jgi:hypothetical protein
MHWRIIQAYPAGISLIERMRIRNFANVMNSSLLFSNITVSSVTISSHPTTMYAIRHPGVICSSNAVRLTQAMTALNSKSPPAL